MVRGQVFYERYAALRGDPTYIRGQFYVSRMILGELPYHLNSRETVADSDDEDPDGLREVPPVGGGDGRDGGSGGDSGGEVPIPEQPTKDLPVHEQSVPEGLQTSVGLTNEGLQRPVSPKIPLGTILEMNDEAGGDFTERSWVSANFVYDGFGRTPPVVITTPSSADPLLRETAIADLLGVQTVATLGPLPLTVMCPPALSPELDGFASRPPLVSTHEGGAFTSAVPEVGSSSGASLIFPPPIPREILYAGVGLH